MKPGAALINKTQFKDTLNLTLVLARREVSAQYKGTLLGRLWSMINPLATILVFTIIFGLIFRGQVPPGTNSGIDSFAVWIGIGVLAWGFFSGTIDFGMNSLENNAGLLTKVYFPRYTLIVSQTLFLTFNFIFELAVLIIVVALVGGIKVLLYVPLLVPIVLLTAIFCTGLALQLSIASVYFRDVSHLWGIFTQIWMYASGVIFPLNMLQDVQDRLFEMGWQMGGKPLPLVTLFRINPAETFLEAYRAVLYDFTVPPVEVWIACIAWSALAILLGVLVFRRHSPRLVEEL